MFLMDPYRIYHFQVVIFFAACINAYAARSLIESYIKGFDCFKALG
jgi:hypothetical protein